MRMGAVARSTGIALLLLASPAAADGTIAGRTSIIDADTIDIHGERIRILDVDAPESRQPCIRPDGSEWRCGQKAALALADWIGQQPVTCDTAGKDRYGRWLARCIVGGEDVGRWLAMNGWVVPYRDCKCETIRDAASAAKVAKRGIWSGTFEMPWDWRSEQRSSTSNVIEPFAASRDPVTGDGLRGTMVYITDILLGGIGAGLAIILYLLFKLLHSRPRPRHGKVSYPFVRRRTWSRLLSRSLVPSLTLLVAATLYLWPQARGFLNLDPLISSSCNIKGNISMNTGERIYHVPGGEYYDETRISPGKGERWFCSEAEAQAAGWRRSKQ
jgi:endonuclease YncB( thermonuclease family)